MIYAVSNSTVPHFSVFIGSSYGAGTYGMSGRACGNRFTFLWPTAKIAVMGPKQIAGVMSIVRRGQAARKGEEFNEEEDAAIVAMVEEIGARSDEGDAGALAGAGEFGILGEEAVAGVDGIDLFFAGEVDDALEVEIGFDGALPFADEVGFVRLEAVEGEAIFLGVDGDGADAEFIGRAKDTDGDLAAVQG